MAKKRIINVVLLLLIDMCSGIYTYTFSSAPASQSYGVVHDIKLVQLKSQALHYYQGIRIMYDFARQLRRLQEQERAFEDAPCTAVHNSSGSLRSSRHNGVLECRLARAVKLSP